MVKERTERASLYSEVTSRIIAELEEGRLPWVQPWDSAACSCSMPQNAGTARRYSGINVLILWAEVVAKGYASQCWLTYRQAEAAGGNVRRGEKGTVICYADRFTPKLATARTGAAIGRYVALSRHRDAVNIYYGRDDFANQSKLVRTLSRERGKDMASDYRAQEPKAAQPKRGMFDGLKLTVSRDAPREELPERKRAVRLADVRVNARALDRAPQRAELEKAVERFARVTKEIVDVRRAGGKELPHELERYSQARQDLDALRPGGANDLREAFGKSYKLTSEAAAGRTAGAIAAMDRQDAARAAERVAADRTARDRTRLAAEAKRLAAETEKRAELFVAGWKKDSARAREAPTHAARDEARANLTSMAKSLHRDPQLESLLHNRRAELGLKSTGTGSLSHDLQRHLGLSRGIGISM